MYSTMLTKLMITTRITSWERDNHIAICIILSLEGDYSRMAMVSRSLMERCSPEGRWRPATAMAALEAALGDSGPWPPFFLGDGSGMEEGLHLTAVALEEENS